METHKLDPGATFQALKPKEFEFDGLETFPSPGNAIVRMTSDEVTSLCPITGQPDFEIVDVTYAPRDLCVESKSLKLYLFNLRTEGAFVEALAMQIASDFADACAPNWVRVDVTQKARGGISIVAVADLVRDETTGSYVRGSAGWVPPINAYKGF